MPRGILFGNGIEVLDQVHNLLIICMIYIYIYIYTCIYIHAYINDVYMLGLYVFKYIMQTTVVVKVLGPELQDCIRLWTHKVKNKIASPI